MDIAAFLIGISICGTGFVLCWTLVEWFFGASAGTSSYAAGASLPERISLSGSNVLGATGMSRRSLSQYVSRYGLFGRDSVLDAAEQATVQAALGQAARTMPLAANDRSIDAGPAAAAHLEALREFVKAAVNGRGSVSRAEWTRAEAAGLSREHRSEVLAVVGLMKETLGLPLAARRDEIRIGRVAEGLLAANRQETRIGRLAEKFMKLLPFRAA